MFPLLSHRIRMKRVGWALFLMLLADPAHAQLTGTGIDDDPGAGMRGGTNTIVGRLTLPSGGQLERRYTVRLSSVVVGEFSTTTDTNGVFTFRRLREGSYFLRVDGGREYLPAQETVDLYDNRGRTLNVQIELRPRPLMKTKPGVINATLTSVPKAAREHYQKAMASAAAGNNKKAIEQLTAAVDVHPQFVLALNEMSALYLKLGQFEKAGQSLAEALEFEPENAALRLNYGYVLMLRGRFEDSERELHRAVQLRQDSSLAHLYRGKVLIKLRNFDEAEKELNRVISLGGDASAMAYRYLGALHSERGDTVKAVEALEKYLSLKPNAEDAEQVKSVIKQLREPK